VTNKTTADVMTLTSVCSHKLQYRQFSDKNAEWKNIRLITELSAFRLFDCIRKRNGHIKNGALPITTVFITKTGGITESQLRWSTLT